MQSSQPEPVGTSGRSKATAVAAAGQNGIRGYPPPHGRPQQQQQQHLLLPNSQPGYGSLLTQQQQQEQQQQGTAFARRCQSLADFQLGAAGSGSYPVRAPQPSWQPASMPEQPAVLGSAEDPRWGALAAAASVPNYSQLAAAGRGGGSRAARIQAASGSAPVFSPFELKNMMDESSLEIFESQSHLLDPETRLQLQKQRQYLEWQQSSMEDSGPMRASLERCDSAGSGSEAPADVSGLRHEMRTLRAERDATVQRANELCQQLQDKKRQLFTAIQEREQLKERCRQSEAKLKEYQEVMHCRLCHTAVRNCVVLPCLHFLYCDTCFKKHCTVTPTCPACNMPVSGFQTLMLSR